MKSVIRNLAKNLDRFITKIIIEDDLFLLSSSVSFYSALGLAPFLVIVVALAGLLRTDTQSMIIAHANATFSPDVGTIIRIVFENAKQGIEFTSLPGIIGTLVVLFTASIVFTRFRYAFDVIYGYRTPEYYRNFWETILDKIFAMAMVLCGAVLLIASLALTTYVEIHFGPGIHEPFLTRILVLMGHFTLYLILFTGLHHIAPTVRPRMKSSFKMAVLSSIFFIIGNTLLTGYLKSIASSSVYGAAGTLLVFLVWAYYSSFTIFLSTEAFLFLKQLRKSKVHVPEILDIDEPTPPAP